MPKSIPKNGKGNYGRYVLLDDLLEAVRIPLAKHGIVLIQWGSWDGGRLIVSTRLQHKSGQWMESELSIKPSADTAQQQGGAMTYGRRYQACAMLGISADDDDDGAAVSERPRQQQTPPKNERIHAPTAVKSNDPFGGF